MNNSSGIKNFFGAEMGEKKSGGENELQRHGDESKATSSGQKKLTQRVTFVPMEVERKITGNSMLDGPGETETKLTAQQRYRRLKAQAEDQKVVDPPISEETQGELEDAQEIVETPSKMRQLLLEFVGDPPSEFFANRFIASRFPTGTPRAKFMDQVATIGAAIDGEVDWDRMKRNYDTNLWGIFHTSADMFCATIIFLSTPIRITEDGREGSIPRVFTTPGPRGHGKARSMADIDESVSGMGLGELDFARQYLIQAINGPWESMAEFGNEVCAWRGIPFDTGGALTGALLRMTELYVASRIPTHSCVSLLRTVARNIDRRPQYVEVFISVYAPVGADLNIGVLLHLQPPMLDRFQMLQGWLLQLAPAFDYLIGLRALELVKLPTVARVVGLRPELGAEEILQGLQPLFGEAGFLMDTAFFYIERARLHQTSEGGAGVADSVCFVPVAHDIRLPITLMVEHTNLSAVPGRPLERTYLRFGNEEDQRKVYRGPFQASRGAGHREDSEGFRSQQRGGQRAPGPIVVRPMPKGGGPSRAGEGVVSRSQEPMPGMISRSEVASIVRSSMEGAAAEMVAKLRQAAVALAEAKTDIGLLQSAQMAAEEETKKVREQQALQQSELLALRAETATVKDQVDQGLARQTAHEMNMARQLAEIAEVQALTDRLVSTLSKSQKVFQEVATEGITELRTGLPMQPMRVSGWQGGPPPAVYSPVGGSDGGDTSAGEQGRASKKRNAQRNNQK